MWTVLFFLKGIYIYIYIYIYMYISSLSSFHAISTDIPDPFLPPFSINHCFPQVFKAISSIGTKLLYVGSSLSSWLCSSMWRGPPEYVTHELTLTSLAVSRMSRSSNFDSFRDGWKMAVQHCFVRCWLVTSSILLVASLWSCYQAFSLYILLVSM